jgi:hypothetical protein
MHPCLGSKSIPISKGAGTDPKGVNPQSFVDRTKEIERARVTTFDKAAAGQSTIDLTPGHKRMAGMP